MICTATGIALLILIAIYGILYVKRENFTSTINFVNVLDTLKRITQADKDKIMVLWKAFDDDPAFENALKAKILERDQIIALLNETYNKFTKEFDSLAFKYNIDTADVFSLIVYMGVTTMDTSNKTAIEKHNFNQLQFIIKSWTPPGKAPSTPQPTLTQSGYLQGNTPSSAVASTLIATSKSTVPTPSVAPPPTASLTASLTGSMAPTQINTTIRDTVKEELRLAGLLASGSQAPKITGANFAYDSGIIQKAQNNAACASRDWCCRCRQPSNRCGCQRF